MKMFGAAILGLILGTAPLAVTAQGVSIGEREYMNSCAQCHGADGSGGGVLSSFLSGTLPNLRQLQAQNDGVFPVSAVYAIVDGTETSGVHGTSEMPAWGDRYMATSPQMLGEYYRPEDREVFVRGRILALVEYLSTLQDP